MTAKRVRTAAVTWLVGFCVLAWWGCNTQPAPSGEGAGPGPSAPAASAAGSPGGEVQKLGMALAGADAVSVEDLLKDPAAYAGKTVRVSGKVDDFCHHQRAWFAITAASGKGMVRVFTVPRFKVPADCLGKQAVAEGKVDLITIEPERAKHFGKDHKFLQGVEVKPGEAVTRPVLRAFGAEFR